MVSEQWPLEYICTCTLVLGGIEILLIDYCEFDFIDILGSGLDWYPVAYGSHNCTLFHIHVTIDQNWNCACERYALNNCHMDSISV